MIFSTIMPEFTFLIKWLKEEMKRNQHNEKITENFMSLCLKFFQQINCELTGSRGGLSNYQIQHWSN